MYPNYLFRGEILIAKSFREQVGDLHDTGKHGDILLQIRDQADHLYRLVKSPGVMHWGFMPKSEEQIKHYRALVLLLG